MKTLRITMSIGHCSGAVKAHAGKKVSHTVCDPTERNKIFTEGERGGGFFNPKLNRSLEDNLQDFWTEVINWRGAYGILVP